MARPARGATRERQMSLGQHLLELRKRLFFAAIGILLGMILGFFLSDVVLEVLRAPIETVQASRPGLAKINFTTVTEAFDLRLQIALYTGLIISSPVWLYQVWAFIVPGLTRREKRYGFGFFFAAAPLFLLGCAAGLFVLPHVVELLASFAPEEDATLFGARYYFDFVLKLIFAVGVAFVLPVFVVLLNFVGVLSASAIIHGWRIAILAITVFTAIATPAADVFSMFLLAIPMVILYFAAYGVAVIHDHRAAKRLDSVLNAEPAV